jgi:hypothetical protein
MSLHDEAARYLELANDDSWLSPREHRMADLIRRMDEALRLAERDAVKYRWGINQARWLRHEHEAYVAIPVAIDADLSCRATRDAAIDAAMIAEGAK